VYKRFTDGLVNGFIRVVDELEQCGYFFVFSQGIYFRINFGKGFVNPAAIFSTGVLNFLYPGC